MYTQDFNAFKIAALVSDQIQEYLEAQVQANAPKIKPLVAAKIKVERVGFTRNASNTPYIVNKVGDCRCCTNAQAIALLGASSVITKVKVWHSRQNSQHNF